MEARSLANLNYLAANPPQYPVNPTEQKQEPLTLYISRVPGTRDVILSPFRPQLKNVTGEDVANSLYYIHFDTSRPDLTAPNPIRDDAGNSSDDSNPSRKIIPRKPVGAADRPPTPDEPPRLDVPIGSEGPESPLYPGLLTPDQQHAPALTVSPPARPLEDSGVGFFESVGNPNPNPAPITPAQQHPGLSTQMPARKPVESQILNDTAPAPPPLQQPKPLPQAPLECDVPHGPTAEPFTSSDRPYSQQSLYERGEVPDYYKPHHKRPYSQQDFSGLTLGTGSDGAASPKRYSAQSLDQSSSPALPPRPPAHDVPLHQQPHLTQLPPQPPSNEPPPMYERRPVPQQPPPPPPPEVIHHRTDTNGTSRSPSPNKGDSFHLNLIRRDPSSGTQWNAGRIASYQLDKRSSLEDGTTPQPRPPIDIQLETSGYAKFRNMPARRSIDAFAPEVLDAQPANAELGIFSRQVVMSYSKSFASTIKERLSRFDKSALGMKSHVRNQSAASVDSTWSNPADTAAPTTSIGQPGPGMKPRGYVFNSPWDGRCEFRTGNGGRSVRCRHIIHEGPSAYNPLVAEQQAADGSPPNNASALLSELRFNLPNSEILGNDEQGPGGAQQRLGNFRKFWKREDEDDDGYDDGEVSPFDVNLGREHAGGGNRGRRAKLGKLIIYHDGLKMLDLVVAANVGVWWGSYERNF